jgi:uncharacterized membrane-anchored protein
MGCLTMIEDILWFLQSNPWVVGMIILVVIPLVYGMWRANE